MRRNSEKGRKKGKSPVTSFLFLYNKPPPPPYLLVRGRNALFKRIRGFIENPRRHFLEPAGPGRLSFSTHNEVPVWKASQSTKGRIMLAPQASCKETKRAHSREKCVSHPWCTSENGCLFLCFISL